MFAVFGTPSAFPSWLLHLTGQIAEELYGPPQVIACVFYKDLRSAWAERGDRPAIVYSDSPEQALAAVFLHARLPVVIAGDTPLDALRYAMAARGLDFRQALRFLTQSYSTLAPLGASPGATFFGPRHGAMALHHFIPRLAEAYRQTMSDTQIEAVAARMTGPGVDFRSETVAENVRRHLPLASTLHAAAEISAEEARLACLVLDRFAPLASGHALESVVLPPELLHDWDQPNRFLGGPQELVGPARILTAGHVIHLPVGAWTATFELEIEENLSGNALNVDILAGDTSLAGVSAPLPATGAHRFNIDFESTDAFPALQARIVLQEGAIEGRMRILSIVFSRAAGAESDLPTLPAQTHAPPRPALIGESR